MWMISAADDVLLGLVASRLQLQQFCHRPRRPQRKYTLRVIHLNTVNMSRPTHRQSVTLYYIILCGFTTVFVKHDCLQSEKNRH